MERLILAADIHGHNVPAYRLELFRQQLRELTNQAVKHKAPYVVIAGDLVHSRYKTPGVILLVVQEELEYANSLGITWVLIPGNHDIPSKIDTTSILEVFRHCAYVVENPEMIAIESSGTLLCLAPWRPMAQLKEDITAMAHEVQRNRCPSVLIGHTALKEGKVSRSNYQVADYEMSVADLHPDIFTQVYLGDYHAKQKLADNVMYLGSIVEHNCSDFNAGGIYLLDCRTPVPKLESLPFIKHQPRHLYWDLRKARSIDDLLIPQYNEEDYNRIEVPVELEEDAHILWPGADIRGVVSKETAKRVSRLGGTDTTKPHDVLETFVRIQHWEGDSKLVATGKRLLQRAISETDGE